MSDLGKGSVRCRTELNRVRSVGARMQRYYTHVRNGAQVALDTAGEEFESSDEAVKSNRRGARIAVANEIIAGRYQVCLDYMIHDKTGELVAEFGVMVTVSGLD